MNMIQKFLVLALILSLLNIIHPLSSSGEKDRTEQISMDERAERMKAAYEREENEGIAEAHGAGAKPPMHQASPEEFQAWLQGYAENGGNASRYAGIKVSPGVSVVESNFSTYVDSFGQTNWLLPGFDMGDGNIRCILVPANVTYLGGGVGKDKSILLMENFTVIERQ